MALIRTVNVRMADGPYKASLSYLSSICFACIILALIYPYLYRVRTREVIIR